MKDKVLRKWGGFSSGPRGIIVQPLQLWYNNISQGIFRNATVFLFFFYIYEGIFFTLYFFTVHVIL